MKTPLARSPANRFVEIGRRPTIERACQNSDSDQLPQNAGEVVMRHVDRPQRCSAREAAMAMYIPILGARESKGRLRLISQHSVLNRWKSPKLCWAASCASSGLIPPSMLAAVRISIWKRNSPQLRVRSDRDVARHEEIGWWL